MIKKASKTKKEKELLEKAKKITLKQYPNMTEKDVSFPKIVQSFYQSMRKAMDNVKVPLLNKAAETVALYSKDIKKQKELVLETYFVLHHHFMGLTKAKKLTEKELAKARKLQGRRKFHGMDISIENRKGSVRKGKDPDGHEWKTKMKCPYGYIRLTEGSDGEHVDCYLGNNMKSEKVFVIHQVDPYKKERPYDEDKVMLGFDTPQAAKKAYVEHYDRPDFFGSMDTYDIETFKEKVKKKKGKIT